MQGGRELFPYAGMCVYDQLVSEYPVMWLRDSTRIGACYTLRELLSPEGDGAGHTERASRDGMAAAHAV